MLAKYKGVSAEFTVLFLAVLKPLNQTILVTESNTASALAWMKERSARLCLTPADAARRRLRYIVHGGVLLCRPSYSFATCSRNASF